MIVLIASAARERVAYAALCAGRGWMSMECESLSAFRKSIVRQRPRVVLTRHRLGDGYSDDVLALLADAGLLPTTKVVVLTDADGSSMLEARQIRLGADHVQRDPVRVEVLTEYLAKYQEAARRARNAAPPDASPNAPFAFACAIVHRAERKFQRGNQVISLTPRETALIELLVKYAGQVVTYDDLYAEILERKFRGDTSNMRVLLGKLAKSALRVGIALRDWVEVIPKTGYRYRPAPPHTR